MMMYDQKAMTKSDAEGAELIAGLTPEQAATKLMSSNALPTDAEVGASIQTMKALQAKATKATGAEADALWEQTLNLMQNIAERATDLGRSVNMFRLIGGLTPEGAVRKGQRLVRQAGEGDPNKVAKIKDFTKKANKPPKVDPNQLIKDLEAQLQGQNKPPKPKPQQGNVLPDIPEGMKGFDVKAKIDEAVSDANKVITDLEKQLQKQTELPKAQAGKEGLKQPDIPEGMGGLDVKAKIDEAVNANNKKLDELRNRVEKETGVPVPKPDRPHLDTLKYPKVEDLVKAALAHLKKQRDDMLDLEKLLDARTKGGKPIKPPAPRPEDLRLDLIALAKKYSEVRNLTVAQFEKALVDEIRTKLQLSGDEASSFATSLTDAMTGRMGNAKQRAINSILKAYDPKKPTAQKALVAKFAELANLGIVGNEVTVKGNKLSLEDIYAGKFVDQATTGGRAPLPQKANVASLKVSLRDIVKKHYTKQNATQAQLVAQIAAEVKAKKMDISPSQINEFATAVHQQIKVSLENARKAELDRLLRPIEPNATARKPLVDRAVELANLGALNEQATTDLLADKLKLPKLTPEQAKELATQAEKMQNTQGKDNRVKEQAILGRMLADLVPPDMWDKVEAYRIYAMLSSPKTAVRNVAGNAIMQAVDLPAKTLASGIDALVGKVTGKRTIGLPDIKIFVRRANYGFRVGKRDWKLDINTRSDASKYNLPRTKTFKTGFMSKAEDAIRFGLQVPDRVAYEAVYGMSLSDQLTLLKQQKKPLRITDEMKAIAHHDALYATFSDDNIASKMAVKLRDTLNAGKKYGAGSALLPFAQVPANLLNRGFAFSPAGFVRSMYLLTKPLAGGEFDQRAFSLSLARAFTGSVGGFGLAYLLANNGVITGERPTDATKAEFEESVYGQFESINLNALMRFAMSGFTQKQVALEGDTLVSYNWAQPIAIVMATGANLAVAERRSKEITGLEGVALDAYKALGMGKGALNSLLDTGMLQGVQGLFGGRDPNQKAGVAEGLERMATDYPLTYLPSVGGQLAQLVDPTVRETKGATPVETLGRKAAAKVPVLSTTQPARRDALGNDKPRFQSDNVVVNAFNTLVNPAFVKRIEGTPLRAELERLYQQSDKASMLPNVVQQNISVVRNGKKEDKRLTAQEISQYQGVQGEATKQLFELLYSMRVEGQEPSVVDSAKAKTYARLAGLADSYAKEKLFGHEIETAPKAEGKVIRGLQFIQMGKERGSQPMQQAGQYAVSQGVQALYGQALKAQQPKRQAKAEAKRRKTAMSLSSTLPIQ
jgi:hypothetical protein